MSRIRTGNKPDQWLDQGPSHAGSKTGVRVGGPSVGGYHVTGMPSRSMRLIRVEDYSGELGREAHRLARLDRKLGLL